MWSYSLLYQATPLNHGVLIVMLNATPLLILAPTLINYLVYYAIDAQRPTNTSVRTYAILANFSANAGVMCTVSGLYPLVLTKQGRKVLFFLFDIIHLLRHFQEFTLCCSIL